MELANIDISIDPKQKKEIANLPFLQLKEEVLGKDYELSISFLTKVKAKTLNKKTRNKDYIPNTLSFPYSDTFGEMYLQLETIYEQAPEFELSQKAFLLKIYIHSLLHLKGLDHSVKMDKLEDKYLAKYLPYFI